MVDWLTWTQVIVGCGAGLLCLVSGVLGRVPGDVAIGSLALVELLLVVQVVVTVWRWIVEGGPVGSGVEFAGYLLTALIIPPAAVFWGLIERTRWSTIVLSVAAFTIAVMVWRMNQIWTLPSPWL